MPCSSPRFPTTCSKVAAKLREKANAGRTFGLVVVAEGATLRGRPAIAVRGLGSELKASLSPGPRATQRAMSSSDRARWPRRWPAGCSCRPTRRPTRSSSAAGPGAARRRSSIGNWGWRTGPARCAPIKAITSGVMVAFQPPDLKFVPLAEAINKVRTVPADSEFVQIARSLGISPGDEERL